MEVDAPLGAAMKTGFLAVLPTREEKRKAAYLIDMGDGGSTTALCLDRLLRPISCASSS